MVVDDGRGGCHEKVHTDNSGIHGMRWGAGMSVNVKLYCGDNRVSLRRLIDEGVRVHSVVTDPPYAARSLTRSQAPAPRQRRRSAKASTASSWRPRTSMSSSCGIDLQGIFSAMWRFMMRQGGRSFPKIVD